MPGACAIGMDDGPTHIRGDGWLTLCGLDSGKTRYPLTVSTRDARTADREGWTVRWCPVCARAMWGEAPVAEATVARDCSP